MTVPRYIVLTGARNNSGDHLIRSRAIRLLREYRPDREIVEWDRGSAIDGEKLALINDSSAVLLTGGPGLQRDMYPGIYPLVGDLDAIKAPILTFGVGWKSNSGEWKDTCRYPLSPRTLALLDRIDSQGMISSVRDYHTLNVLESRKYRNFRMTGCPACFVGKGGRPVPPRPMPPRRILFSAGVAMLQSPAMFRQGQDALLRLRDAFPGSDIRAVFHHSIDPIAAAGLFKGRAATLLAFSEWCGKEGFPPMDVSGGLEKMEAAYNGCDLHVGYRVHAHIYCLSMGLPSFLMAEDGRGTAVGKVFEGTAAKAYVAYRTGMAWKIAARLFKVGRDPFLTEKGFVAGMEGSIRRKASEGWPDSIDALAKIKDLEKEMAAFLNGLP